MPARAIFPTEMFEVARKLAAGAATFQREAAALDAGEWLAWTERGAYSDGWQVYPFVMTNLPAGLQVDFRRHRARCPGSWALLSDPRIVLAGFSRLLPGAHIYPHTDSPAFDMLRFHVGLHNAGNAGLRVRDVTIQQRAGEHYVIDTSIQHEAANLGTVPRDVLLVDFRVAGAELDEVERLRAEALHSKV